MSDDRGILVDHACKNNFSCLVARFFSVKEITVSFEYLRARRWSYNYVHYVKLHKFSFASIFRGRSGLVQYARV